MEDIKLLELCKHCKNPLTLMTSCRGEDDEVPGKLYNDYLVIRCLNCGQHPITEVVRLDSNQTGLNV